MAKEYITGLTIQENVIEWMSALRQKNRFETSAFGRVAVKGESIPEEEGAGGDAAKTEAGMSNEDMARIKLQCRDLKGFVTAGVDSSQVLLRVVSLPAVEAEELAGMVELQIDKISPFPVESMVVSHEVLKTEGDTSQVMIAAVKRDVVVSLGQMLISLGMHPLHVDVLPLVWWNLLKKAGKIKDVDWQIIMRVDSVVEIMVLRQGVPVMIRSWGMRDIGAGELAGDMAGDMAGEIKYTLFSLEMEHGPVAVESISLWYKGDAPMDLGEKLAAECLCDVVVESIDTMPSFAEGLVRRAVEGGGRGIDLAPEVWKATRESTQFKKKATKIAVFLFAAWVFLAGVFFGGFQLQKYLISRLGVQQEEWRNKAMEVGLMRRRVVMIGKYMDRTRSALECLREISEKQPQGIDLNEFEYTKGEDVEVKGNAVSAEVFYEFKKQMDVSKLFVETEITSGPTRTREGREDFVLKLKLPADGQ